MDKTTTETIRHYFEHHVNVIQQTILNTNIIDEITNVTNQMIKIFNKPIRGKILIFGNGGSAADAQHLAAEFINRFIVERNPLPMLALTTDTSTLTAIPNDYSFNEVFVKQIQAYANIGDIVIGISTSGNSINVLKALEVSKRMGCYTVLMTNNPTKKRINELKFIDSFLKVYSTSTARIQECHILIGHTICRIIDSAVRDGIIKQSCNQGFTQSEFNFTQQIKPEVKINEKAIKSFEFEGFGKFGNMK